MEVYLLSNTYSVKLAMDIITISNLLKTDNFLKQQHQETKEDSSDFNYSVTAEPAVTAQLMDGMGWDESRERQDCLP